MGELEQTVQIQLFSRHVMALVHFLLPSRMEKQNRMGQQLCQAHKSGGGNLMVHSRLVSQHHVARSMLSHCFGFLVGFFPNEMEFSLPLAPRQKVFS